MLSVTRKMNYMLFPVTSGFPAVSLEMIVDRDNHLNMTFPAWNSDPGAGSFWDLTTIAALTASLQPKLCFEIGTGQGRAALTLALNSHREAVIYTLDIGHSGVGAAYKGQPGEQKIRQIVANSKSYQFDEFYGKADMVLVDGGHDRQSVLWDSEIAFRLIRPGGVILWHDFTPDWPGVISALRSSKQLGPIYRLAGTGFAYSGPVERQ